MATDPNEVVRFYASDMILCADTDASYLIEPKAHIYATGEFILGITPSKFARERLNGPIF